MQISEHFTLEEMTFSEAAARLGIDNTPTPEALENLVRTAATMEAVRAVLGGKPINVHSGYRSPQVNRSVGGVDSSAHCQGLACDFVCPAFGRPAEVARAILSSNMESAMESAIEYDQLILEYGWVHVGLAQAGRLARREALTKRSPTSPYELGITA
jgi:zinc D-Ala-D-Ala carboxypeptidase